MFHSNKAFLNLVWSRSIPEFQGPKKDDWLSTTYIEFSINFRLVGAIERAWTVVAIFFEIE